MRTFETGATRDNDDTKIDYEGFLSPLALESFGRYMTKNRIQADGKLRDSDNWQKGIPRVAYMKSAWRHFMDLWALHRASSPLTPTGHEKLEDALCGLFFNVQGYLHEYLKESAVGVVAAPVAQDIDCYGMPQVPRVYTGNI